MLFEIKSLNQFALLASLVTLVSCQSFEKKLSKDSLVISSADQTEYFEGKESHEFKKLQTSFGEFFVFKTEVQSPEDAQNLIERRRSFFIQLFEDDLDPYTGAKIERKMCLKGKAKDAIEFVPGPGVLWSDCRMNQKSSDLSPVAIRVWKACGLNLWEVTFKTESSDFIAKLSVDCF